MSIAQHILAVSTHDISTDREMSKNSTDRLANELYLKNVQNTKNQSIFAFKLIGINIYAMSY